MVIVNMLGSSSDRCPEIHVFIMVGNFQFCPMGEIIFAIINLLIGAFALCFLGSDSNKKP